jgi:hypothetical protein
MPFTFHCPMQCDCEIVPVGAEHGFTCLGDMEPRGELKVTRFAHASLGQRKTLITSSKAG